MRRTALVSRAQNTYTRSMLQHSVQSRSGVHSNRMRLRRHARQEEAPVRSGGVFSRSDRVRRAAWRGIAPWLVGLLCLASCGKPAPPPHPLPADTPEARREQDLDYLVAIIEAIHPDPFLRMAEADFRAQVEQLRLAISEADEASFQLGLLRLLASLQDAHCGTSAFETSAYPIALPALAEAFDEGYFLSGCTPDHLDLLGARILSIDGHDYESLVERCAELIPAANPHRVSSRAPRLLMSPRILHALGLSEHADRYTAEFELPDGKRLFREFTAGERDFNSAHHILTDVQDLSPTIHPQPHESGAPYWWEHQPDEALIYLQYNAVQTHDEYPFDEMVEELLARIERDDVETLVVDVRYNGGGNNGLIDPLDDGLSALRRRGTLDHLYVLTGSQTFSSGVDVAVRLQENAGAEVVGTATGGMPNSFGNAVDFNLPNSDFEAWCSSGYFRLLEGEPPTLEPDVDVGRPWADYGVGRDTAMEWVRSQGTQAR